MLGAPLRWRLISSPIDWRVEATSAKIAGPPEAREEVRQLSGARSRAQAPDMVHPTRPTTNARGLVGARPCCVRRLPRCHLGPRSPLPDWRASVSCRLLRYLAVRPAPRPPLRQGHRV